MLFERRILEGSERRMAERMAQVAFEEALKSPCKGLKQGVVFERSSRLVSRGHNAMPQRYVCVPQFCEGICDEYTIHAAESAVINAGLLNKNVIDSRGYRVDVADGRVVPSVAPSCFRCAGVMGFAG